MGVSFILCQVGGNHGHEAQKQAASPYKPSRERPLFDEAEPSKSDQKTARDSHTPKNPFFSHNAFCFVGFDGANIKIKF
jgi:hypothetical protein